MEEGAYQTVTSWRRMGQCLPWSSCIAKSALRTISHVSVGRPWMNSAPRSIGTGHSGLKSYAPGRQAGCGHPEGSR